MRKTILLSFVYGAATVFPWPGSFISLDDRSLPMEMFETECGFFCMQSEVSLPQHNNPSTQCKARQDPDPILRNSAPSTGKSYLIVEPH